MFLVDSNVWIDVVSRDAVWFGWSSEALARCLDEGEIAIDPVIYAEVSVPIERIEDVESLFDTSGARRLPLPWEAAFLAGKAFAAYRARGGDRKRPLPDFFIGAHAVVSGLTLVTRDPRRFRTAFPKIRLVAPPL